MRILSKCLIILILLTIVIGCKTTDNIDYLRKKIESGRAKREKLLREKFEISKNGVRRERFIFSKYPQLLAVGQLDSMDCTVVLVAEDIVVTASHCLQEKSVIKDGKISDVKFNLPLTGMKIVFQDSDYQPIGDYEVKEIVSANSETDFAILQLENKIPNDKIKPLKLKNLTLDEMLKNQKKLGCAGFNGDKGLGTSGYVMTISRNIKVITESSSEKRIDTNCISTSGGSGGLLFEEVSNTNSEQTEIYFLGVIWGVTNDTFDEEEKSYKNADVITSITPVNVFYDELKKIIDNK